MNSVKGVSGLAEKVVVALQSSQNNFPRAAMAWNTLYRSSHLNNFKTQCKIIKTGCTCGKGETVFNECLVNETPLDPSVHKDNILRKLLNSNE